MHFLHIDEWKGTKVCAHSRQLHMLRWKISLPCLLIQSENKTMLIPRYSRIYFKMELISWLPLANSELSASDMQHCSLRTLSVFLTEWSGTGLSLFSVEIFKVNFSMICFSSERGGGNK